jgi:hypothetical protein
MYVRWQQYRSSKPRWLEPDKRHASLKAILVESVRVDGKPRQKHIAFLGSIELEYVNGEIANAGPPGPWGGETRNAYFWRDVTSRLKRLGNRVGPEDYERIVASIAAKVGGRPLSDAELEQLERKNEESKRKLFQKLEPLAEAIRSLRPPRRPRPVLTDEEIQWQMIAHLRRAMRLQARLEKQRSAREPSPPRPARG